MFVAKNQIYVFIACVSFGLVLGLALSIASLVKHFIKIPIIKDLPIVFTWIVAGVFFSIYSNQLNFPNFRFYMIAGVFISLVLYYKSFHIILAKIVKKIYNRIVKERETFKETKDD